MSLINGRVRGINQQEFDIRTGRDDQDVGGGGKIYEVDPAAVAHFKAVLAAQPPRKPQAISSQRYGSGRIDPEIRRRANELAARARAQAFAQAAQPDIQEVKELTVTKEETTELTEAAVRLAHARFAQGESVKALAAEMGVPWQTLRAQFRRHGLTEGRQGTAKNKPVMAGAKVETAVVPVRETAVAVHAPAPSGDLRTQLVVIQELLNLAEAQSVTLSGKISVDLHAEVAF